MLKLEQLTNMTQLRNPPELGTVVEYLRTRHNLTVD